MAKKINFYHISRDGGLFYGSSDSKDREFYSPSLPAALDVARNLFLDGANVVTIENLGKHDLKF